jgi:hypothetical protein
MCADLRSSLPIYGLLYRREEPRSILSILNLASGPVYPSGDNSGTAYETAENGVLIGFAICCAYSNKRIVELFIVFPYIFDDKRTHNMVIFLMEQYYIYGGS